MTGRRRHAGVRVGVLGAGVVGSQVVRLLHGAGRRAGRPGRRPAGAGRGRGPPARPASGDPGRPADHRRGRPGRPRRHRCGRRGDRRHRADQGPAAHRAAARGAGVVTANKALLAEHGPELYEAADAAGADLYFEAAVAGAIPLIRPLRESLAGDRISRIMGIVNGTTNFILSAMVGHRHGLRTRRWPRPPGSATPRPTPPRTSTASTRPPRPRSWPPSGSTPGSGAADVHREGIAGVSAADIAAAREIGCTVKLLAICERVGHRRPERRRRRATARPSRPGCTR